MGSQGALKHLIQRGYLRSKILITPGAVFLSPFFHILLHIQWWCNSTDKLWINNLTELIPWIKSCHLSSSVTSRHDVFTSWGYGGEGCLLAITCDDNTMMHSTGARPQCSMSSSMNKLAMYCGAKGRHALCNITTTALVIRAQHAPNLDCHHHFCNNTKAPAPGVRWSNTTGFPIITTFHQQFSAATDYIVKIYWTKSLYNSVQAQPRNK